MAEPIVDRQVLDELVDATGGDVAFVADLIETYVADAARQLAEMRAAVAAGDSAALLRPAHSLKSASASVGVMALSGTCRDIEELARRGEMETAGDVVEHAAADLEEATAALQAAREDLAG